MPARLITSIHNPRVKEAVRLRDRRHRQSLGRMLIDGGRELSRAIAAGITLREVFVCPALCTSNAASELLTMLPGLAAEVFEVPAEVFSRLAYGDRAEGVLGVADMPNPQLADLRLPECPLVVVLEGVEKPGNLGAVLRSADGAGASAVIAADARTDLFNPNAIRASLGTIFSMPLCSAPGSEIRDWLVGHVIQIFAARVEGSTPYTSADYRRPTAIVLGSEATGLTPLWAGPGIVPIGLPMLGIADSLNVSVTAAVILYEALRQRETASDRLHRSLTEN